MNEFKLSEGQSSAVEILVRLVGISGVDKKPEQGEDIVLDLLPASHVAFGGEPFCVRVVPSGAMYVVSDEDAGIAERPS